MRCPECQSTDTKVVDSRTSGDDAIRRRRECLTCGERFTTHERIERPMLWVVKRDGRKEPFEREKIMRGISLACRKRPVDAATVEQAIVEIEGRLETLHKSEFSATLVGEQVMAVLRDIDEVAYVRFASVYRAFESVDQFVELVRPLRESR